MQLHTALAVALVALTAVASARHLPPHNAAPTASEFQDGLDFLRQYMPETDKTTLSDDFLRSNVELALTARYQSPWARAVPFDTFLDNVIPYANVDEPREDWRGLFHSLLSPLVANSSSITEAALVLNRELWKIWGIHFKSDQTPEIMSPSQVIRAGYASCTGLSIFLVNAYRSVGIPARVAGTPAWNNQPTSPERFNNHNWVEVWDTGTWSFTGPVEWTPLGLNHTWFVPDPARLALPGNLMHAIYAATFRPTPTNASNSTYFPLAWKPTYRGVPALDVTDYYLAASAAATARATPAGAPARQQAGAEAQNAGAGHGRGRAWVPGGSSQVAVVATR